MSPATDIITITPADIGMPPKFSSWRGGQWNAILTATESDKRFIAHSASTGSGKSVLGVVHGILSGTRAIYLTSTKNLQDQLSTDFKPCGMADLRGRQNYPCSTGTDLTCAEGRLIGCRDKECPHLVAKNAFLQSNLGITNYSCYFSNVMHSDGLGPIGLLILDEAHCASDELASAIEIRIDHAKNSTIYRALNLAPPYSQPLSAWKTWAFGAIQPVKSYFSQLKENGQVKKLRQVDGLVKDLERLSTVEDDWILDDTRPGESLFSPLWPTAYAEKLLFRGIPKVLLLSATIVPKTLSLLGCDDDDCLFISHQYTFDHRRAPVYLFGSTRVSHKSTDAEIQELIGRMDTLIGKRLDRKGIIHTVSYDRQQFVVFHSEHNKYMLSPRGSRLNEGVQFFKASKPPSILVSPSVTTGYDFPGAEVEWQMIIKMPFIDARSPVMAARAKADSEYLPYLTAQTLVQTCGRGMRSAEDRCENFILDAHANWFLRDHNMVNGKNRGGYRHLFPSWFIKQLQWPKGPPPPAPKL